MAGLYLPSSSIRKWEAAQALQTESPYFDMLEESRQQQLAPVVDEVIAPMPEPPAPVAPTPAPIKLPSWEELSGAVTGAVGGAAQAVGSAVTGAADAVGSGLSAASSVVTFPTWEQMTGQTDEPESEPVAPTPPVEEPIEPGRSSPGPQTAGAEVPSPQAPAAGGDLQIDHSSPQAFLGSFVPAVKQALAAKGLPQSLAPILAAIPMNEQGWQAEAPGNNYYGIKGCHDENTDVLTEDGWKPWPDVVAGDALGTWNAERCIVEYQYPTDLVRYRHRGRMYRVCSADLDILVTPDHRLWVRPGPTGPFRFLTARDAAGCAVEYLILREMPPTFSPRDLADSTVPHSEAPGNLRVGVVARQQLPNFVDIAIGQLGIPSAFAVDVASFALRIGHIRGLIPQEQVIGPHASRGIAAVQHVVVRGQCDASSKLIRNSMGAEDGLLGASEHPVALRVCGGGPQPAWAEMGHVSRDGPVLVDLGPEAGFNGLRSRAAQAASGHDTMRAHRDSYGLGVAPRTAPPVPGHRMLHYTPPVQKVIAAGEWADYDGMVYCATVPNGLLLTRRNGKIVVSGNSNPRTGANTGAVSTWEDYGGGRQNIKDTFRAYGGPAESVADFIQFLEDNPRYGKALDVARSTGDPASFIRAVHAAGYATDPAWSDKILSIASKVPNVPDVVGGAIQEAGQTLGNVTATVGQDVQSPLDGKPPESTLRSAQGQAAPAQATSEVDQAALDDPDKWALCGPVAAVLAAAAHGKDWTVAEAKGIASKLGLWNADRGMGGLGTEVELLKQAGVSATAGQADETRLAADATSGNTPIVSTDGHYYVLQGYDPTTGKFDTGKTGTVYKNGSRWMSLDEMQAVSGNIQGAAYIDNPASPNPSVVAVPEKGAGLPTMQAQLAGDSERGPFDPPGYGVEPEPERNIFERVGQGIGDLSRNVTGALNQTAADIGNQFAPRTEPSTPSFETDEPLGPSLGQQAGPAVLGALEAVGDSPALPLNVIKPGGTVATAARDFIGKEEDERQRARLAEIHAFALDHGYTNAFDSRFKLDYPDLAAEENDLEARQAVIVGTQFAPSPRIVGRALSGAAENAPGVIRRAGEAIGTLRDTATAMTRGLPGGAPVASVVDSGNGLSPASRQGAEAGLPVSSPPPVRTADGTYTVQWEREPGSWSAAVGLRSAEAAADFEALRTQVSGADPRGLVDAANLENTVEAQRLVGFAQRQGLPLPPRVTEHFGVDDLGVGLPPNDPLAWPRGQGSLPHGQDAYPLPRQQQPRTEQPSVPIDPVAAENLRRSQVGRVDGPTEADLRRAEGEPRTRRPSPGGIVAYDPSGGLAGAGQGAVGGGIAGGYEESQREGATPLDVAKGIVGGSILGAARQRLGRRGSGQQVARAVQRAGEEGAEGVPGSKTWATSVKDPNQRYDFHYEVRPLYDLTTSHTDAFTPHPEFPEAMQPRLRDRAAARDQIQRMAATLAPDSLLADTHRLDSGPPIIGTDGLVESGNGRTMAIRLAQQQYPERFAAYQQAAREQAAAFGIDPATLEVTPNPVLVRVRDTPMTPEQRASFADEANRAITLEMSPFEKAIQDAEKLSPETLAGLQVSESQSIDQALMAAGNRQTVRGIMASIAPNERAGLMTTNGELNAAGLERIKDALFAATYPGEAGQRLAQTFTESIDPGIRNIQNGLYGSLPAMAQAEGLVRAGERAGDLSLTDDLASAVDMLARLRSADIPVKTYLAQDAMFERELSPLQEKLLDHLDSLSRSPRRIRTFIQGYADGVQSESHPDQAGMFGDMPRVTKPELVDRASGGAIDAGTIDEYTFGQADTGPAAAAITESPATPEARAGLEEPGPRALPPEARRTGVTPQPPQVFTEGALALEPEPVTAPAPRVSAGDRAAANARSAILDARGKPITLTTPEEIARLRLDKFPSEVRDELQAAATDVDFGRAQRRGVIPDDVANELADTYRQSVERWIREARAGRSYSEEQTLALRNLAASTALDVHKLTLDINAARAAGTTPDLLIAQRAAASNKLNGLVQVAEGARSEAGRSLRAWRMESRLLADNPSAAIERIYRKVGDRAEAEKIADEYSQAITNGEDAFGLAKIWAKVERGEIKSGERFALYRRFNMLSGPRTIEVNMSGGAINLVYEDLMASGGSLARGDVSGAAMQLSAPVLGFQRGARGFVQTLAHGMTEEQALRTDLPTSLSARATNKFDKAQLTVQEIPDRINSAVDQFYRGLSESLGLANYAVRKTRGMKGGAREDALADILANPDADAASAAKRMADRVTYQGDLGVTGQALQHVQRVPILGNVLLPFLRTVYGITTRSIDISPLGALTTGQEVIRSLPGISKVGQGAYAAGKELPKGVPELSTRLRDNVAGTLIFAWAYDQARQGNITGAGPDDVQKREELRATGWRPYSVKIGDSYHSYANVAPLTLALSSAAGAHEAQKYGKPGDSVGEIFADGAARTVKVIGDMSVVSGIGAIVRAQQDPERYGTQWLTQFLQTLIPAGSAVNTVGQATDTEGERRSLPGSDFGTKVSEGIKSRIPQNPLTPDRGDVPLSTNPLGEVVPNQQQGFGALQPTRPSREQDAPVIRAFLETGVDIGAPPKGLPLGQGVSVPLSPAEQRQWQQARGPILEQLTQKVMANPRWAGFTPAQRAAVLENILDSARTATNSQMVKEIGGASEVRRRMVKAS